MATTTVTSVTLEKVDRQANNDKFYRVYYAGAKGFGQNGSQRNGRTGGQKRMFTSAQETIEILGKKKLDGYVEVESREFTMDVATWENLTKVNPSDRDSVNDSVSFLEGAYMKAPAIPAASQAPASADHGHDVATPAIDRLAELSNKYLDAIGSASKDPIEGFRIRAVLADELEPLNAEVRKLESYMQTLDAVLGVTE